jgi:hypothetical protein
MFSQEKASFLSENFTISFPFGIKGLKVAYVGVSYDSPDRVLLLSHFDFVAAIRSQEEGKNEKRLLGQGQKWRPDRLKC